MPAPMTEDQRAILKRLVELRTSWDSAAYCIEKCFGDEERSAKAYRHCSGEVYRAFEEWFLEDARTQLHESARKTV